MRWTPEYRGRTLLRAGLLLGAPCLLLLPVLNGAAKSQQRKTVRTLQYNRDVRPILSDKCFHCHGPDKNNRQAGLRLDVRQSALEKAAIVPGKPTDSKLVTRIFATDATQMPPESAHKTLTDAQKNLLKQWIVEGAEYQPHWAYLAPKRPPVPTVRPVTGFAIRNPIDAFLLKTLTDRHITPSHEADKRTLIRRVTLDLLGLPPTESEVNAFLKDTSPNAYEKVVERLLASPHYGERMAVPWLDVVRYADTVGFHGDQNQNAWAYRDYVIDSFNHNKPFDQFTTEQLAGDLLPNPTPEQRTATCFNRLNMMTREGGAQPKEYLAKYAGDRVRTVSMTWLGSTFGCAECHDHKYDPISQKDFYAMAAFFADMKQWGVYMDYGYTPNPDLRGFSNDHPFPPEITVESRYLKARIAQQRAQIVRTALQTERTLQDDATVRTAYETWRKTSLTFLTQHPDGWQIPPTPMARTLSGIRPPTAKPKTGVTPPADAPVPAFRNEPDGSVLLTDANPGTLEISLKPDAGTVAALRVELLPHALHKNTIFRPGMSGTMLTMMGRVEHTNGKRQGVAFRYAGANLHEPRYVNGFDLLGVQRGWKLRADRADTPHVAVWLPETPIPVVAGDTLTLSFPTIGAGCVRVATSPFVPENPNSPTMPADLRAALENPMSEAARTLCLQEYLFSTAWDKAAFDAVKAREADLLACRDGETPVLVTEATTPMTMRVLPRGNWQDESGDIVQPAVPHFLPQASVPTGRTLTRLDLAKWLLAPENPLTARVYVNRLWRQFFGNGLSGQVEDLGAQGEWPTHPELLDWLAVEFREKGWNIKHMVRLLVTSSTYRQSSSLRPDLRDSDPNNRLLASQNPRRLDAEFVRDNALAIAGLLNPEEGGPPVKPYQPAGYYANIQFPDRTYPDDPDDRQYRRGVYMHWQRTFLHPMLANFDAPSREDCTAARIVANTPQQALTLLNSPTFVEAARVFAAHLLASPADDAARLEAAFQRALTRPIKPKEKQSLLAFLANARAAYKERPDDAKQLLAVGNAPSPSTADPVELAAWASVCRVLLNLNETITRY